MSPENRQEVFTCFNWPIKTGRGFLLLQMQTPMQNYMDNKESENMRSSKETNEALTTNCKEMDIYELPDKKCKIIILKKLNEMQEN